MHDLVRSLKTSHTGFFHQSVRRVPARLAIGASFRKAETEAGLRWVAQDVHEGGPAHSAGLRPLDVLQSVNGTFTCPPEQPMFPMGSEVELALRRGADDIVLRVTIPPPRDRKQPYSEPKAVAWATHGECRWLPQGHHSSGAAQWQALCLHGWSRLFSIPYLLAVNT